MAGKRAVTVSIDQDALKHNFAQVKHYAPNSKVMPVIKANAYGHGMLQVARVLDNADGFAVAQLSEAIELRESGIDKPLTVFQGVSNKLELELAVTYRIRPAISQIWQIDLIESVVSDKLINTQVLDTWLKINTGMGRLGVQPVEVKDAWQRLSALSCINQLGLMMHFANADVPSHASNQLQIACFSALLEKNTPQTSVSNSAAIMSRLYENQSWVRPGIMLYGSSPVIDKTAQQLGLQPVMTLQAKLIAVNKLQKGQHVGYGDSWTCPEDMPVGIVNIGYGDGYPRHALTGTPLMVNGQQTQLVGRVSMDSIAVDLRGINTECGDTVELWGKFISVDEVARNADTISYELLCNAGRCSGLV